MVSVQTRNLEVYFLLRIAMRISNGVSGFLTTHLFYRLFGQSGTRELR